MVLEDYLEYEHECIVTGEFMENLIRFSFHGNLNDRRLARESPGVIDEMMRYGDNEVDIYNNMKGIIESCESCSENYFSSMMHWNKRVKELNPNGEVPFCDPLHLID